MRTAVPVWLAGLVLALGGCVGLPESGPVVEAGTDGSSNDDVACCYLPNGPQPGESATDIVQHFLEAMQATPIQTTVAQQFLTEAARASWDPEQQTIVYGERGTPRGDTRVSVALTDAHRLDSRGVFAGPLRADERTLSFRMAIEGDEWRIAEVPRNALIVPQTWTEEHFSAVDVYYVDPTARILVPEPVTVPRGDQFATALARSLLSGPGPALDRVSRNFLPRGLSLFTVPVDADGVADVAFQGDASGMSAQEAELAAVQVAWTLRQDPSITSIRLTADGQALPGQPSLIPVDGGGEYDPADFSASDSVFALRDGRLVSGQIDAMSPVDGPAGQQDYGITSFGVSLDSTRLAGVTGGGSALLLGPTHDEDGTLVEIVSGATSLLPPVWDFADRMWLIDRTPAGAQVTLIDDDGGRLVEVPGITGARVRHVLVSRDGSRLIAAVRRVRTVGGRPRPARDDLLASRIQYDDRGDLLGATPARKLSWPTGERPRVRDVAWRTPTSVAVLHPIRDVVQVRTLAVDGSPASLGAASSSLPAGFRYLIGSPEEGGTLYAASTRGYTDLTETNRTTAEADAEPANITYTG